MKVRRTLTGTARWKLLAIVTTGACMTALAVVGAATASSGRAAG